MKRRSNFLKHFGKRLLAIIATFAAKTEEPYDNKEQP
jgi:hypothetical protein